MEIIDILKQSAELLGLNAEVAILATAEEENEQQYLGNENIASLFDLIKFSIQELCSNYVPVVTETSITTTNKSYALSNLTNYIRLKNVTNENGDVRVKIINRVIAFDEDGTYTLTYLTYPDIASMFDDVDYLSNLSPDALVFGLCAYFCLAHGRFEEFKDFHERYVERAESLKELKIFNLPNRRWE